MEQGRLSYLRFNQNDLRTHLYSGVIDAVNHSDIVNASNIGQKIILPSTFTGGPMGALYQDAMSIIRDRGKPDLFITKTCNPDWPEIKNELLPTQVPNDRPDLIAKVFKIRLKIMCDDLFKNGIFGKSVAHLYVIEWQKRGYFLNSLFYSIELIK